MDVVHLCNELRKSGSPPHALALLARYGKGRSAEHAVEEVRKHVRDDSNPAARHLSPRVSRGTVTKAEAVLALGHWPDTNPHLDELPALTEAARAEKGKPPVQPPGPVAGPEGPVEGYTREELRELTVEDLKELAADEEINLHGASRKDEIVEAIFRARGQT